ncbi:Acetoacetyl-CoA synthetase, partial [Araneus ventricosus]
KEHNLESLEIFASGGSIVKPNNYEFVQNKVKKDVIFTSSYGSTELMGSCMSFDISLPIYRGEISCPSLAIDLDCVDDSGNSVRGELGELVIKKPTPSLPLGLWDDSDASRYKETHGNSLPSNASLMVGKRVLQGEAWIDLSDSYGTHDLGDKLGDHFGDLARNLATLATNR